MGGIDLRKLAKEQGWGKEISSVMGASETSLPHEHIPIKELCSNCGKLKLENTPCEKCTDKTEKEKEEKIEEKPKKKRRKIKREKVEGLDLMADLQKTFDSLESKVSPAPAPAPQKREYKSPFFQYLDSLNLTNVPVEVPNSQGVIIQTGFKPLIKGQNSQVIWTNGASGALKARYEVFNAKGISTLDQVQVYLLQYKEKVLATPCANKIRDRVTLTAYKNQKGFFVLQINQIFE